MIVTSSSRFGYLQANDLSEISRTFPIIQGTSLRLSSPAPGCIQIPPTLEAVIRDEMYLERSRCDICMLA
ncbi:hypothetical protein EYC84_011603 [Monilinia fructicola]|uniref:Uncharacterized protein n=1 Tax=Monilinia fructicola TaxID=38448 RepID=A0A5M9J5J5_MONFR|nr:hypothetical protein EYC84_011603 [Monilinia fructicola]